MAEMRSKSRRNQTDASRVAHHLHIKVSRDRNANNANAKAKLLTISVDKFVQNCSAGMQAQDLKAVLSFCLENKRMQFVLQIYDSIFFGVRCGIDSPYDQRSD